MPRIERVESFLVCYPLAAAFKKFLAGSPGRYAVVIKITANDGTVGWGQSLPVHTWSYETPETSQLVVRKYFGPALLGCDPLDLPVAQRALDRAIAPGFSTAMPISRAGLDIALHDLAGKLMGKSIPELWGRRPRRQIQLSWTVCTTSLQEAEAEVQRGKERGYRNFNIKVGGDPKFDVQLARLVRRLVPHGLLWADANGGYDLPTAKEVIPKLADAGVDVLEAPLRPNRISGYQALKRQGALPIIMDEGVVSPVEAEEFIRLGMVDGLAIKVSRSAGLESSRRQIELVEKAGLFWLGSGLSDPDISLTASVLLFGAYGLGRPAALNGPQFLAADILTRPLAQSHDMIRLPDGPGLGIEVDMNKLQPLLVKAGSTG